MAKRAELKEIKYVPQVLPGQRGHLTSTHLRMQTWLLVNIVRILTMLKEKRNN